MVQIQVELLNNRQQEDEDEDDEMSDLGDSAIISIPLNNSKHSKQEELKQEHPQNELLQVEKNPR